MKFSILLEVRGIERSLRFVHSYIPESPLAHAFHARLYSGYNFRMIPRYLWAGLMSSYSNTTFLTFFHNTFPRGVGSNRLPQIFRNISCKRCAAHRWCTAWGNQSLTDARMVWCQSEMTAKIRALLACISLSNRSYPSLYSDASSSTHAHGRHARKSNATYSVYFFRYTLKCFASSRMSESDFKSLRATTVPTSISFGSVRSIRLHAVMGLTPHRSPNRRTVDPSSK